jgi:hypothetical protein
MDNQDIDRLLEQSLSGDPPRRVFRAQVLLDSTAALVRHRQVVRTWRLAALSAAAVVIVSVSFLLGRSSMGPRLLQPVAEPAVAGAGETVAVPKDLVACLSAARLFKQLGMEDRMNRALDCADRLLPREAITASSAAGPVFAASGEGIESQSRHAGPGHKPGERQSVESMNRVLAGSLGGYYHASEMD